MDTRIQVTRCLQKFESWLFSQSFAGQKSKPKNLSTNAALEVILPDTFVTTNDISVHRMAFEPNKLAPIYSIC